MIKSHPNQIVAAFPVVIFVEKRVKLLIFSPGENTQGGLQEPSGHDNTLMENKIMKKDSQIDHHSKTKSRFSSRELFELRNNIPVDMLIRDLLQIPSKIRDGYFRFLCPLCNEFQTAVNPATNLARCFRCGKNFNTIDLVMKLKGYGFRDSVLFLKQINTAPQVPASTLTALAAVIGRPIARGQ